MNFNKMYGLFLRHFYLIKGSLPRILDLVYWPTIQIVLWGFISKFFSIYSDYYSNTVGVCLLYTSPSPRDRTRSRMPSSA